MALDDFDARCVLGEYAQRLALTLAKDAARSSTIPSWTSTLTRLFGTHASPASAERTCWQTSAYVGEVASGVRTNARERMEQIGAADDANHRPPARELARLKAATVVLIHVGEPLDRGAS
jgi:hypothetical protein